MSTLKVGSVIRIINNFYFGAVSINAGTVLPCTAIEVESIDIDEKINLPYTSNTTITLAGFLRVPLHQLLKYTKIEVLHDSELMDSTLRNHLIKLLSLPQHTLDEPCLMDVWYSDSIPVLDDKQEIFNTIQHTLDPDKGINHNVIQDAIKSFTE